MLKPRRTDISRQERPSDLGKEESGNKCRDQSRDREARSGGAGEWEGQGSHDPQTPRGLTLGNTCLDNGKKWKMYLKSERVFEKQI